MLNVVDDDCIVQPDELGLSEDAFARLNVEAGHPAHVLPAEPPPSLPALRRKIAGERLDRKDLHAIIRDVAQAVTRDNGVLPAALAALAAADAIDGAPAGQSDAGRTVLWPWVLAGLFVLFASEAWLLIRN